MRESVVDQHGKNGRRLGSGRAVVGEVDLDAGEAAEGGGAVPDAGQEGCRVGKDDAGEGADAGVDRRF